MSKYLITGVQGFVGRYFVEYLLSHEPEAKIFGVDIAQTCDMPIAYHSVDLNNAIQTEQIIQSTILTIFFIWPQSVRWVKVGKIQRSVLKIIQILCSIFWKLFGSRI